MLSGLVCVFENLVSVCPYGDSSWLSCRPLPCAALGGAEEPPLLLHFRYVCQTVRSLLQRSLRGLRIPVRSAGIGVLVLWGWGEVMGPRDSRPRLTHVCREGPGGQQAILAPFSVKE